MNIIKSILSRLSMKLIENRFTDVVSGKPVGIWRDRYGNEWLADGKFGMRIKR